MINLGDTSQRVHLVGIGGVGVSAIAEILNNRGFIVSGSDAKSSNLTKNLEHHGIRVIYEHTAENVENVDFVVYTTAVGFENPELSRAQALNIPCITRPEMLGMLMSEYKKSIAVTGTHGKTTTSSMIAVALERTNMDPTLLIGGEVKELGTNARVGKSDIMVAEACEYKESFLNFRPNISVILNIDADHLDYYKDLEHIIESFGKYVKGLPQEGTLIYNGNDLNTCRVAELATCDHLIRFGMDPEFEYHPENLTKTDLGFPEFDMIAYGEKIGHIALSVPGQHNVFNVLAATAAAIAAGAPVSEALVHLGKFKGAARRFDYVGSYNNAKIIDDYAHHPSEVQATLSAAAELTHNRIICVFQPHTYTRTYELMNEFTQCFDLADEIIITDIYAAREQDNGKVHASELAARLTDRGCKATYLSDFEDILNYLQTVVTSEDLVFTMGAGNVCDLGKMLVNRTPL